MPTLSVIIPVFNSAKTLKNCVNSVINQTYNNIEIILVNDGSTDGSEKIINELSYKYSNIKVKHSENHGVSYARNLGLKIAKGKYISFVDSDDTIKKDMFKEMISCINLDDNIDLVISYMYDDRFSFLKKEKIIDDRTKLLLNSLNNKRIGGFVCNKIFKRDIIIKNNIFFDTELYICEDLDFCIKYYKHVNKATILKKNFYLYDLPNTTNSFFSKKRYTVINSFKKIIKYVEKNYKNQSIVKKLNEKLLIHEIWLWYSLKKANDNKIYLEYNYKLLKYIKEYNYKYLFKISIPFKYRLLFLFLKNK